MQPGDINELVAEAGRLVADLYVFPDLGSRIAERLDECRTAGRYSGVDTAQALAGLVTEDLQAINGDRHLRLKYHHEEVPDLPGTEMLTAMISAQAARSMGGVARVDRLEGNVALVDLSPLLFPPSMAGGALAAAMQLVAPAEALILDLRRNVGGDPSAVALVCSYLFDEPVHLTDIYQREGDRTVQSWTLPYVPGARFGGTRPVYVLTSASTFSGGEELAYDLQQLGRATVVGERTAGGAHPRIGRRLHPHLELTVPTGRAVNPVSGTNWEAVGVTPDVAAPVDEALAVAHRAACAPAG